MYRMRVVPIYIHIYIWRKNKNNIRELARSLHKITRWIEIAYHQFATDRSWRNYKRLMRRCEIWQMYTYIGFKLLINDWYNAIYCMTINFSRWLFLFAYLSLVVQICVIVLTVFQFENKVLQLYIIVEF